MSKPPPLPPQERTGCIAKIFALIGAALSGAYLLNPTAGLGEIIPDIAPLVGNLDEVFFTGLLVLCLAKLGIHLPWLTRNRPPSKNTPVVVDEKPKG